MIDDNQAACKTIDERGLNEIGHHGYHYEGVLDISLKEERAFMKNGVTRIEKVFGVRQRGNRSPPFALDPNTADPFEEFGFAYDSSPFGHDEAYRPREFVELPVSWDLDGAPYFLFNFFPYMASLSPPTPKCSISGRRSSTVRARVGSCFLLVVRPFCIRKHPWVAMLSEFVSYILGHGDAWFVTHVDVATEWRRVAEDAGS